MAKKPLSATTATTQAKDDQTLPSNEASLLKQVVKLYEDKQYKKAVKIADGILKKFPKHGETLAMKGLVLYYMKRQDEGRSLVKQAISCNLKSHVCWHVYGLIYRADRMYDDAIKCYQNALKFAKDDQEILKDLSMLQIQQRNLEGFQETRRKLLVLKSNVRANWLAFAVGTHLAGHHKSALDIIKSFESTQNEESQTPYDFSELRLYEAMVLEESGDFKNAMDLLDTHQKKILDKQSFHEAKARLFLKLGNPDEAKQIYEYLLKTNPDNHQYHYALRDIMGLKANDDGSYAPETVQKLIELYNGLQKEYPKSAAVKRLPLDFTSGAEFKSRVSAHMKTYIRKAIPSLFRDLKPLYSNPEKLAVIEELLLSYLQNLREHARFSSDDESNSEVPSVYLWALFYAGLHYDYKKEHAKALEYVNEAITHTPTVIDLYILKARITKHSGDFQRAFELMDFARCLDLADRYLNTKCVRYAQRALHMEEADKIVALFLRGGDNLNSLFDLQVMWYEISSGHAFIKKKDYGRALKKLLAVDKHFQDIEDDQFDFHGYCVRRSTLRAYVKMLRFEDNLRSHRFYFKAATTLIEVYMKLFDNPDEVKQGTQSSQDPEQKTETKKAKDKGKNQEDDEEDKAQERVDDDPDGRKLLETKDPLGEATKFLKVLQLYSSNKIKTHNLAMEVYLRKGKYLLVLQAMKRGLAIDPNDPNLHKNIVRFYATVDKKQDEINPTVLDVVNSERKSDEVLGGRLSNLLSYTEQFLAQNKHSLPHRVAAAESLYLLDSSRKKQVLELATDLSGTGLDYKDAVHALEFIASELKDEAAAEKYREACHHKFPLSPRFMNENQLKAHQEQLDKEKRYREGKEEEADFFFFFWLTLYYYF